MSDVWEEIILSTEESELKGWEEIILSTKESELKRSKFTRICVFCGSSSGNKSSYSEAAGALVKELVWASLMIYRQILDAIEANDYDNFTKRAYVGKSWKFLSLPIAYARSLALPSKGMA